MKPVLYSLLLTTLVVLCVACGSAPESQTKQKLIVNTAVVQSKSVVPKKEFPFISKPFRESELSLRVGGPIDQFEVYPGDYYRKGDRIARIDPRDFAIRRERAQAVYSQAKAEFERIEVLYTKNNISASAFEKAKSDYTTAKTAFESAENELTDTELIAPFSGYIGQVYIEKHQDVKATQPVVSLVDIDQLKIELFVTQDIAFNFQDMKEVSLYFDTKPEYIYKAKVAEISKSTTRNNLSYLMTVLLPNKDGKLLSGMSGKVIFEIDHATAPNVTTIPQTALCHRPTVGDYVWVVDSQSGVVKSRSVTRGALQKGGTVVIDQGLSEGEMVAVSSLRFLSDGTPVEINKR